jgi:glycerol-3-phosphate cytidylyltransferase
MLKKNNLKKVVITYGTFDMFHIGHLNLLNRAKELGNTLIVGVSTDKFNEEKGKKTLIPYDQRVKIVQNIRCVDKVIPERNWNQKINDISEYDVDVFAIGYDWKGEFDALEDYCEVHYLPRTEKVSTSDLKKSLSNFLSIPKEDILNAFDILTQLKKDFE